MRMCTINRCHALYVRGFNTLSDLHETEICFFRHHLPADQFPTHSVFQDLGPHWRRSTQLSQSHWKYYANQIIFETTYRMPHISRMFGWFIYAAAWCGNNRDVARTLVIHKSSGCRHGFHDFFQHKHPWRRNTSCHQAEPLGILMLEMDMWHVEWDSSI